MSGGTVTPDSAVPGFYGKIPALGDFVSRRLPRQFIDPWDQWLESAFAASREQLGSEWRQCYLTSPIWRFGFMPGLLGDPAWMGILMPSVDKVGRYFPLTLAAPVAAGTSLPILFAEAEPWFETIEQLALSALGDGFDLERFDIALRQATLPGSAWIQCPPENTQGRADHGRFLARTSWDTPAGVSSAFAGISTGVLDQFLHSYSLWRTAGSDRVSPSLLVCEGMPPIDIYAAFLSGQWPHGNCITRAWIHTAPPGETQAPPTEGGRAIVASAATGAAPIPGWRWLSHGISDIGLRRKINEDAFIERSDIGLWAVADGMGGHQSGEVASAAVVNALAAIAEPGSLDEAVTRVTEALTKANGDLWAMAGGMASELIIGSTVVALLVRENRAAVLWAGDSRLYRYRAGFLEQLTRDHSFPDEVSESVRPEEEGPVSEARCNIITRAVGADPALDLELRDVDFRAGDVFLLCSDGLDKEAGADRIAAILGQGDCETCAKALIQEALSRGARDNVTVVVVRCKEVNGIST